MNTTLQTIIKVTLSSTPREHLSLDYTAGGAYAELRDETNRRGLQGRTELLRGLKSLLGGLCSDAFGCGYTILDK